MARRSSRSKARQGARMKEVRQMHERAQREQDAAARAHEGDGPMMHALGTRPLRRRGRGELDR